MIVPITLLCSINVCCEIMLCSPSWLPVANCILPQLLGLTIFFPQSGLILPNHCGLPDLLTHSIWLALLLSCFFTPLFSAYIRLLLLLLFISLQSCPFFSVQFLWLIPETSPFQTVILVRTYNLALNYLLFHFLIVSWTLIFSPASWW